MSINKNFVVKNGLEVNTDLIVADATTNSVGIANTSPQHTLHVNGGIGATDVYVSGIVTASKLNIGVGGTIFSIENNKIGIGTTNAAYSVHIVGVGTALYVDADIRVTGDLNVDDVTLDQANINSLTVSTSNATALNVTGVTTTQNLNVTGVSTYNGYVDINANVDISNNLNVSGVSTLGNVKISSGIITASSGIVTYYGDGRYLDLNNNPRTGIGIRTTGGVVGYGITFLDFKGSGVSTTSYNSSTGIATIFFEGGGSNSGSTLNAATGTQRIVVTSQTSGSMTSAATDADLTFDATTNTLSVPQSVVGSAVTINSSGINAISGVITASSFVGNLSGTATTATNLANAANITTGTINSSRLTGSYNISISGTATTASFATTSFGLSGSPNLFVGVVTASSFVGNLSGTATTASFATTSFGLSGSPNLFVGVVTASSFVGNLSGTATTATNLANAANITAGTLAIARGGTNATATPTAGGAAYGTGSAYAFTSAGTSGQILQSNGSAAPTWIDNGVGIRTAGGTVGTGATILDFRGSGISTVTVSSGIATINVTGGARVFSPVNYILS